MNMLKWFFHRVLCLLIRITVVRGLIAMGVGVGAYVLALLVGVMLQGAIIQLERDVASLTTQPLVGGHHLPELHLAEVRAVIVPAQLVQR